ncbi:MAG: Ppx/GppA phosphatase family protein [Wenzhouxiangella sp.]|jgi:exopolyphosphatase/guanosine-5'-triphosphate,3'-diphosphate pyrophosphatase|nr:Ppx/GppA phosphatase family protein [Wenzhouxiangella sp.]
MPERELYAAIDLGSNSFHMIVARSEHGELRIIDRIKEMVRLAGGLDHQGRLAAGTRAAALDCLARFGQRIRAIPATQVRAVGTQTFRRLRNPASFLVVAETALGCPIEIISGREEARLVYLGVSQGFASSNSRRLVIDIGGGSTEIVAGQSLEPVLTESVPFGCVGTTRQAFPDGRITRKRWDRSRREIERELQGYSGQFRRFGWEEAVGSSGTIRAVASILAEGDPPPVIELDDLGRIRDRLIDQGHVDRVDLPGLSAPRAPVIAGGVLILDALRSAFGIDRLGVSTFALREGLLFDLKGRLEHRDPRDKTVRAMAERYQVDPDQAARIADWCRSAFEQVAQDWKLSAVHADFLHWIALLHEIGLAIAHDAYQQHSAYILSHADMPGFSRHEQQFLAVLAQLQRRRIHSAEFERLPARLHHPARCLLILLRLAVLIHRPRSDTGLSDFALSLSGDRLRLETPANWLAANPLTRQDLDDEARELKKLGITLYLAELTETVGSA